MRRYILIGLEYVESESCMYLREDFPCVGDSKCKGLEEVSHLIYSRDGKTARVGSIILGEEKEKGKVGNDIRKCRGLLA